MLFYFQIKKLNKLKLSFSLSLLLEIYKEQRKIVVKREWKKSIQNYLESHAKTTLDKIYRQWAQISLKMMKQKQNTYMN